MTGKTKALGLALVAIAALSAIAASSAQAGTLDIEADPAVITGHIDPNQEHVLSITKSTGQPPPPHETFGVACKEATLESTVEQDGVGQQLVDELQATATYGSCTLFGLNATMRMNGCKYTLTGTQTTTKQVGPPHEFLHHEANTWTLDIVGCTPGQQITFQSISCQLRIPEQNHLSHLVGDNSLNSPHSVTLTATISNITHTQFGVCPDGNNHHSNNMSFTGNTTLKAYTDGVSQQVQKHNHQYKEFTHVTQKNLTST